MKRLSLIVSAFMALAFTACTNDDSLSETMGQPITITAITTEINVTRVEQEWGNNEMKLSWSTDDQFSVIRGEENQIFTKSNIGTNNFTGTLPTAGTGNYYASYPLTSGTDHEAIPFDISAQTEDISCLMYAASDDGESYRFRHALAYLKLIFSVPEALQGKTTTLTLTLPAGVYADGTINLITGTLSGGSQQSLTKTVTFGTENTEVLLAIPPILSENKTLQFLVTEGTNNYSATLKVADDKAIEVGKYYTATITLGSCLLPGYDISDNLFNSTINDFLVENPTLTKIKFIAYSTTTGTQIGTSGAYMISGSDNTLEIHTAASEFIFPADCHRMFYGDENKLSTITSIDFNDCVNTANVMDMSHMFNNCTELISVNMSSFNTANVTDMSQMFKNCISLTSLDVTNFNTAAVTDMNNMFYNCTELTVLDVSSFNTANVTNMASMFDGCSELTSLDLINFNTKNVTDMNYMFFFCYGLTSITFGENFSTAKVTNMKSMFSYCNTLTSLDLTSFTFKFGANFIDMFHYTGRDCATKPIPIYVSTQANKEKLEAASTGIDSSYATIVVKE